MIFGRFHRSLDLNLHFFERGQLERSVEQQLKDFLLELIYLCAYLSGQAEFSLRKRALG